MTSSPYSRAPITEAVIELRTEPGAADKDLDRAHRKMKGEAYPQAQKLEEVQLMLDTKNPEAARAVSTGIRQYRLSSEDGADVVILATGSLTTSRLAPYRGWEDLLRRAQAAWKLWRDECGKRPLVRVGVRYLNRVDIPEAEVGAGVDPQHYFTLGVMRPQELSMPANEYVAVVRMGLKDPPYGLRLAIEAQPPVLIDHVSFKLDLDLSLEVELPKRDDDLWARLEDMRVHKNRIFESLITDKVRELIA